MKMKRRRPNFPLNIVPAALTALVAAVFLFSVSVPVMATELSPAVDRPVDRIIIEKSKRTMTLLKHDKEVKTYKIALGRNPEGAKVQKGDQRTPEGLYFVDYKVRNSVYHRALHLNYPNQDDIERARSLGVTPGNSIMIHGMKQDKLWMGDVQYLFNWTNGCIALTNDEIEEVWDLVSTWTPVEIKP
jgi:murein L,D-transpeptidase YafK